MNGVRIYVSNDINNTDTILNGEAIDLFKDENIQITLKQTDIRDIATNYTDFTQDFTVPPTPKNRRIFRFWDDTLNDNQWESVSGLPCRIDIGGVFFKKGTLSIIDAQTDENGNLKHYKVRFTANLKALKDKFNDTKLEQLNFDNVLPFKEFDYTDTFVYNRITTGADGFIEFPLVSTKRTINDWNEIKYISSVFQGIGKDELRPALKIKSIFEAIEDNYNVKFTGDFYNVNSPLDKLYLWLNKNEDVVTNAAQIVDLNGTISGDTTSDIVWHTTDPNPLNNYVTVKRSASNIKKFGSKFAIATSTPTVPYKLFIQLLVLNSDNTINEIATKNQDNEGYIAGHTDYVSGTQYINTLFDVTGVPVGTTSGFRYAIESVGSLTVTGYTIAAGHVKYSGPFPDQTAKLLTSGTSFSLVPRFNINRSLPEMTIQDFFYSLIKMFNLVIIPITDPIVLSQLQTADAYRIEYFSKYYGKVDEFDITKYTNRAIKISKIKTYKKIEFKYADSSYGTNLMYKKAQLTGRDYAALKQDSPVKGDDGEFKIETKFNVLIWRELPNTWNDGDDYTLQQTYLIADSLNEEFDKGIFNKPTIFFSNGMSTFPNGSGKEIGFKREGLTVSSINKYNIFSNLDNLDSLVYNTTLTFSNENEFQSQQGFLTNKTLFSNYYSDLLSGVYSPYAREYEVKANLPKHIYTKLSLGSQLIIRNQRFNITDITINLIDGESKLKLNNVIEESNIIESDAGSGSSSFGIDTISSVYYPSGSFTEKEIKINYPINTAKLKWRANYSISTSASGYKVSFTTQGSVGFGGLMWYDFYESGGSTVGNHSTSINQFLPVGTYAYDTATAYTTPITGYMRSKTGNSLTITVIAYDENDVAIAQTSVTV